MVVPRADAPAVLALSGQRRNKEGRVREQLRSGELGLDIYGLRAKLVAMGVEWIDAGESEGDR